MSKSKPLPVTENGDPAIIHALKTMDVTKKRDILNKINLIKTISSDNAINSSSENNNSINESLKNW